MSSAAMQGQLWGAQARDWADIQEPQLIDLWEAVLDCSGVSHGVEVADLGCGAGGASKLIVQRGARVQGLDAAEPLVEIARERVSAGEFQVGDLEALPYGDAAFDVALASNSIQFAGDPQNALHEAARVTRPGGTVAVTVWGLPEQCDTRHLFEAVLNVLPERPPGGGPFALSMPDVLEDLFRSAELIPVNEQIVSSEMAYPDLETAWRGTRSSGPLQGAIRAVGGEPVREAVHDVLTRFQTSDGRVSMTNEFKVLTGQAG